MSVECTQFENELLRAALNSSRIGICVVAHDENVVMIEGSVAKTLFAPADIFIGQHFRRLFVTGMLPQGGRDLFALDAPEIATEAELVEPGGKRKFILFQGRTVTQEDNERYRVVTVVDVTQFGTTRDRLHGLRRQLDALNSAVVIADAKQPDMPITWVNKRFEQMTGYSADFAIGRNCRFLQGPKPDAAQSRKLADAIKRQQSCYVVIDNYRKDGTKFVNELLISPVFDAAGNLTSYVGFQQEYSGRSVDDPARVAKL
jgi:PAS domain S-box-containing protein